MRHIQHHLVLLVDIAPYRRADAKLLDRIESLRAEAGKHNNAQAVCQCVVATTDALQLNFGTKTRVLYPALEQCGIPAVEAAARELMDDAHDVLRDFEAFALQWQKPLRIALNPAGFRAAANIAVKGVVEHMAREHQDAYAPIEALDGRPKALRKAA
jgi:hypothetical protein